jgi:carboxyl-terminal processing protease
MKGSTLKNLANLFVMTAVLLGSSVAWAQADGSETALECGNLRLLESRMHRNHVQYTKWDQAQLDRMVDLYAESIDPTKTLLTEPEYEAMRKKISAALAGAHEGDCVKLFSLYTDELKLQKDFEGWLKKESEKKGLKIDKSIELQVDTRKRERPKNKTEQNELRRKVMHFQLATYVTNGESLEEATKKLNHRYELITRRLEERTKEDLMVQYLRSYALALDPHSSYFSPDDLEDFRISMELSLEGIGAVLRSRDGYTIVEELSPGGAAERQGELKPGDRIIAVGQGKEGDLVDVVDMSLRDVVKKIRGKKGTEVKLQILRQGEKTVRKQILITRDKIDLKQQAAKLRWEEVDRDGKKLKLAIIDLPSFYGERVTKEGRRSCADDVRLLLEEAKKGNADGVLLDLSTNGGGALDAAVEISGLFFSSGPVVGVSAPGEKPEVLPDRDPRMTWDGPLVVLTSHASASASEILAGALQDYKRAVIAGDTQTFGKGTVQNVLSLPPGFGALKITTAMFFLPAGQSTQHKGVGADIVIPSPFAALEIGERFDPQALPPAKVNDFRGANVQPLDKSKQYREISKEDIEKLSKNSSKRIGASKEFKELAKESDKIKKNKGIIKISELYEKGGDDPEGEEKKEDKDKDKLTPQAVEALQVLGDLVVISSGRVATTSAKP